MASPTVEEVVANPKKFLKFNHGRETLSCSGILLAWIVNELDEPAHIYLISHCKVRFVFFDQRSLENHAFNMSNFLTPFSSSQQELFTFYLPDNELPIAITVETFELENGAHYKIIYSDSSTRLPRLEYHAASFPIL